MRLTRIKSWPLLAGSPFPPVLWAFSQHFLGTGPRLATWEAGEAWGSLSTQVGACTLPAGVSDGGWELHQGQQRGAGDPSSHHHCLRRHRVIREGRRPVRWVCLSSGLWRWVESSQRDTPFYPEAHFVEDPLLLWGWEERGIRRVGGCPRASEMAGRGRRALVHQRVRHIQGTEGRTWALWWSRLGHQPEWGLRQLAEACWALASCVWQRKDIPHRAAVKSKLHEACEVPGTLAAY